jgi:hypothetical protein
MTLEEMQAEIERLTQENQKLTENQKNQNSYITKLEAAAKQEPTKVQVPVMDKQLTEYLQRNMRRDAMEEGMKVISQSVPKEIVDCLKPELDEFVQANMTIDKTKPSYIVDAFQLLYGKAMTNSAHKIHTIGQAGKETPPAAPPPAPQEVLADKLRQTIPPGMTPDDKNAGQTPPASQAKIANTRDAMSAFKQKIQTAGQNRFS